MLLPSNGNQPPTGSWTIDRTAGYLPVTSAQPVPNQPQTKLQPITSSHLPEAAKAQKIRRNTLSKALLQMKNLYFSSKLFTLLQKEQNMIK